MTEAYDYSCAQKLIGDHLEKEEYADAASEIEQLVNFFEKNKQTEYIDYLEYLFLLHQVHSRMNKTKAVLSDLRRLNKHFRQNVDPKLLKPRAMELYIKSWTYLGYFLSENGDELEAVDVFQKCLPLLIILRGAESQEVETIKWYIKSIQAHGRITTDEPEELLFLEEEEEGLRCSFCLTGQVDVISGPAVYLCKNCLTQFKNFARDEEYSKHLRLACADASCSFQCQRKPEQMKLLFPGPGVAICDSCLKLADESGEDKTMA